MIPNLFRSVQNSRKREAAFAELAWDPETHVVSVGEATPSLFRNDYRTLTVVSGLTSVATVRGVQGYSTGKRYFEHRTRYQASNSSLTAIGLIRGGVSLPSPLGTNNGTGGINLRFDGTIVRNGGSGANLAATTKQPKQNELICIAVDFDAALIWFRVGENGDWNFDPTADPATGVGGFDLPYDIGTEYFPHARVGQDWCSGFFIEQHMRAAIPAGFEAWGGSDPSITLTRDGAWAFQNVHWGSDFEASDETLNRLGALRDAISDETWAKFDIFSVLANENSRMARVELAQGNRGFSVVGDVTFLPYEGVTSPGIDNYLNRGLTLGTLEQYAYNNAHMGVWSLTDYKAENATTGASHEFGAERGYISNAQGGGVITRTNTTAADTFSDVSFIGHTAWSRTSSADATLYKNGVAAKSIVRTSSSGFTGDSVSIGKVASFSGDPGMNTLACVHLGVALTPEEHLEVYEAIRDYLIAVGAA